MTVQRRKTDPEPPPLYRTRVRGWSRMPDALGPFGFWDEVHDEVPYRSPSLADCLTDMVLRPAGVAPEGENPMGRAIRLHGRDRFPPLDPARAERAREARWGRRTR